MDEPETLSGCLHLARGVSFPVVSFRPVNDSNSFTGPDLNVFDFGRGGCKTKSSPGFNFPVLFCRVDVNGGTCS